MIKFLLGAVCGIALVVAATTVLDGVSLRLDEHAVVPDSCRQPADVDFSDVGREDVGPYAVEVASSRGVLRGTTSDATVGPSPDPDSGVDSGEVIDLQSTDVEAFSCRWSVEGVTIVEPAVEAADPNGVTIGGIEHFVPASQFLGGR